MLTESPHCITKLKKSKYIFEVLTGNITHYLNFICSAESLRNLNFRKLVNVAYSNTIRIFWLHPVNR
ncbi:unnamed protein product [Hymenolepis diminuta]|uniref:Uncharacterized protein n=1 Tax=Hymenolepis diminuta TaxID=6216 RepID=A0A564Y098_HYMDI|nr:unnamed protein product [Hymenolepis diminuta]